MCLDVCVKGSLLSSLYDDNDNLDLVGLLVDGWINDSNMYNMEYHLLVFSCLDIVIVC